MLQYNTVPLRLYAIRNTRRFIGFMMGIALPLFDFRFLCSQSQRAPLIVSLDFGLLR